MKDACAVMWFEQAMVYEQNYFCQQVLEEALSASCDEYGMLTMDRCTIKDILRGNVGRDSPRRGILLSIPHECIA